MRLQLRFLMSIALLCCLEGLSAIEAFPDYKFHTLSPEGGLSFQGVTGVKQDKFGFIWVQLPNELCRFDGYVFKKYSTKLNQNNLHLLSNQYGTIVEDSLGNLFLCSHNAVLKYDRKSDSVKRLFVNSVSNLCMDSFHHLWVTAASGVGILDFDAKTLHLIEKKTKASATENTLFCPSPKEFILSKSNGDLFQFDYKSSKFKGIFSFSTPVKVVDIKNDGRFVWILTEKQGFFKLNIKTKKIEQSYTFFLQNGDELVAPARTFLIDKNKNIWIATQQGLNLLNPTTGEHVQYKHSETDKNSLINTSVWSMNQDRQGNLWFGTFCGGLSYLNFNDPKGLRSVSVQSAKFSTNIISAFAEEGDQIWVGTEGSGMLSFNRNTGLTSSFRHKVNANSLSYDNVKALHFDKFHKKIWIGSFRGGLDCLDLNTKKFSNYSEQQDGKSILMNHVSRLEAEADSGLWIGYVDFHHISFFSFLKNDFKHYDFTSKNNTLKRGSIIDFCRDDQDNLWMASHQRLYCMNVKTKQCTIVPIDSVGNRNLKNMNIQTLFWNKQDHSVWIGTNSSGLIQYVPKTKKFSSFSELSKFNVFSIYSIIADVQNNLWLGTDNGLFKFDNKRKHYFYYDKKDGVQGRVFYPRSCLKSSTGELYFGGTEGFSVVNPNLVIPNKNNPQLIITEFYIDNNSITTSLPGSPLKDAIYNTNEITLSHNESNFGFEFSSTNFLSSDKIRFKYRLKGLDDKWIEVDALRRYVSFTKVPAGKYTFEVLTTNNDGVWIETPKQIRIHVLAAPWLTWWAFLFYLLLLGTISYFILFYYLRQKNLALQLYLETAEMNRQKESHHSQLQFFTNISHDFKTPLSLILGTLERIKQESVPLADRYAFTLRNNAKRLLNLINELMDFQTVENGKMKLMVSSGSINAFVFEHASDFNEYALQRKINFDIILDPALNDAIWFDRNVIEKVIMNLLHNAFKYTTEGSIVIETIANHSNFSSNYQNKFTVTENNSNVPMFGIIIRDTGIGISNQSIQQVFDCFYMVHDTLGEQHLGSGIGLGLVRSLVVLHKGGITIQSERGVGTDIIVALPMEKEQYDETEFSTFEDDLISHKDLDNYQLEELVQTDSYSIADTKEYLLRETKRILLVEDNDELRLLISEMLSSKYEVCQAINGVVATEILAIKEIDLIVSDLMMPLKNGITLCKELKEDISTSHIPFIMLTAKGGMENRIEGVDAGADAYLEKPINFNLLMLTIHNLFNQQNRVKEFYAKNFYSDSSELKTNQKDNDFMKLFVQAIDAKIDQPEMDINYLTKEMSMSRTKLYAKVKSLTDKSLVEFIRFYRMRKAARLLIEEDLPIRDVMDMVGIDTQSYFTRVFKQEYGETPTAFVANAKRNNTKV